MTGAEAVGVTQRDVDVLIEAAHPSRPDREDLTRAHMERIVAARLAEATADRDKYVTAFAEQFDQRVEYLDECKRLWPIEARADALAATWERIAAGYVDPSDGPIWYARALRRCAYNLRAALEASP